MAVIQYGGYRIDAENGVVYGKRGRPIRKKMKGYVWVMTYRNGRSVNVCAAHRMIWEAAVGPIPPGMEINHKNGVKSDNRLVNLEVVTHGENMLHAYRAGLTSAVGERNGRAILTLSDVMAIRGSVDSTAALAARYGVSKKTILDARSGRKWRSAA